MNVRTKFGVVFSSTLLTLMLIIGALMGKGKEADGAYRPLSVYTEVLARIRGEYVEEPDMEKVTRGALQGLVAYLDPLSSYLTAEQYKAYQASRLNDDKGTGLSTGLVLHKQRMSFTQVLAVLPGSAADKAGIRQGDLVEAVDSQSTRNMPLAQLHSVLSGKTGTTVRVLVRPARQPDEPQEFTLTRTKVTMPPVKHRMLPDGIGYIDVDVLDAERIEEVGKAVQLLKSSGAKKLVLDLRANAVGDAEQGVRLADLFLSSGTVVSLKGQRYAEKVFSAKAGTALTDLPLVVITDRATSGGAEIAVAGLLDNQRAKVVGEHTYGLAAFQETILLEDGAALILSVAKYYRPSGDTIQDGGIKPSDPLTPAELRTYRLAEIDMIEGEEGGISAREGDPEKDPYLKKAIEVLGGSSAPAQDPA